MSLFTESIEILAKSAFNSSVYHNITVTVHEPSRVMNPLEITITGERLVPFEVVIKTRMYCVKDHAKSVVDIFVNKDLKQSSSLSPYYTHEALEIFRLAVAEESNN